MTKENQLLGESVKEKIVNKRNHHIWESKRGKWKRVNVWCKWTRIMLSYP
jgi:hypothetical protein